MQKLTLLEKASKLQSSRRTSFNPETMPLALAWLTGKISHWQACHVLGVKNSGNIYAAMAISLRQAYRHGLLVIRKGDK